jgi:transposase
VSNVLNEEKKQQVIALGRLGWTSRRIEEETQIRRETVTKYLKAAGIPVRRPGGWGHPATAATEASPAAVAKPAIEASPDSAGPAARVQPARGSSASACEPFRALIEQWLGRGRNGKAIWQDLVDDYGFTGRYQSVKRFVRQLRGGSAQEPCGVIQTAPGEEGQVDYGDGPLVRHPQTGKYRRTRLFVMTLGYSRKSVRLLVFQSSTRIWAELHERAFRRLGGTPKVMVLDNLKEGVLTPEIYDPTLNPLYRDLLAHYGVVALPCRVNDPNRKGKVESGVGHAQRTPLKGLRFESLTDGQAYLDRWEHNWADTRIHGTVKRQVAELFAEEKPALQPLPVAPFRYYAHGERRVPLDGCVEVEGAYYSTPLGWIGRQVQVQWDERHVRVLDPKTGQLLREHQRQPRGRHRIAEEDRPRRTPQGTQQLLHRTRHAGERIGTLAQRLYEQQGQAAVRRMQGLLALAKKHGAAAVDEACALALEVGVADYRFVRRYLERQPPFPLSLQQVNPLIRELTEYRDVIEARLQIPAGEEPDEPH